MNDFDTIYKQLLHKILAEGVYQKGRNGDTKIIPYFSATIHIFNEESVKLHLRKMYYSGVIGEFNTLISKEPLTNVAQFEKNGCNYWKPWAGPNGELNLDYYNELHPALEDIIEQIKVDPYSRRHVIDLWNHQNVKSGKLSLPCCWYSMIFSVIDKDMHLTWIQRSVDVIIGLPSDVYLAYLFLSYVAAYTGYTPKTINLSLTNVHIYREHMDAAKELLFNRTKNDYNKPLKNLIVKR